MDISLKLAWQYSYFWRISRVRTLGVTGLLMDSFVLHNWICWVNLWDSLNKCDITCCCFFKNLKSRKDLLFSLLPSSTKHNFYEYLWFFLWQRIWKIQKYSSQLLVCPGRAAGANFLIDVHKLCQAGRVEKI